MGVRTGLWHAHLPRARMDVSKKQKTYTDPDFSPEASEILVWATRNKKELFSKLCKAKGWEPNLTDGELDIYSQIQMPLYEGPGAGLGVKDIYMAEILGFADLYLNDGKYNFFVTIKSKVASFGAIMRELKLHRHNVSGSWNLYKRQDFEDFAFVLLAPSIPFADLFREDGCGTEEDHFLAFDYNDR